MDATQIFEDIETLLENSEYNDQPSMTIDGFMSDERMSHTVDLQERDVEITHFHAVSISKIYHQAGKANQVAVIKLLIKTLSSPIEARRKTAVYTLFNIGKINEILKFYEDADYTVYINRKNFSTHVITISMLLCHCWRLLNKPQIKRLKTLFNNLLDVEGRGVSFANSGFMLQQFQGIRTQINQILTEDVKERIEQGFNPEINEDSEKLKVEISKFGFPSDLSEALDKIDHKLQQSKDDFDFKGTMDLLRAFTERVYELVIKSYGDSGRGVDEKDSKAVAKFFKEQGLVNPHFADMITSMRHFLSNTASHRLKSKNEDARLTKNMVIEMTLYLLIRLKNN